MRRLFERTITWLLYAACIAILCIFVVTLLDVALRTLRGVGVRGGNEMAEMALPAAAFLAVAYTQLRGGHVASTLATDLLPVRAAAGIRAFGMLVAVAFLGYMTYASSTVAHDAYVIGEVKYGLIMIPAWPSRVAIALGLLALTLQLALNATDEIVRARHMESNSSGQSNGLRSAAENIRADSGDSGVDY